MILFLVKKGLDYTLKHYLNSHWADEFRGKIRILDYTQMHLICNLPTHLIVFLDHERFTSMERKTLIGIWKHLRKEYPSLTLWNEPGKVLNRLELIRKLYRKKVNDFNAYEIDTDPAPLRYPVFIRSLSYHNGSLTNLIYNPSDLLTEIKRLTFPRDKYVRNDLIIVEFCDTSIKGSFIKYSVLRINGVEIPMLMDANKHWVVKTHLETYDYGFCQEILRFLRINPHRESISGILDEANTDYGRIDYSWKDGKPQVWEINSNPIIKWSDGKTASVIKTLTPEVKACWDEGKGIVLSALADQIRKILNKEPVVIKKLPFHTGILLRTAHGKEQFRKKIQFSIVGLYKKTKSRFQGSGNMGSGLWKDQDIHRG